VLDRLRRGRDDGQHRSGLQVVHPSSVAPRADWNRQTKMSGARPASAAAEAQADAARLAGKSVGGEVRLRNSNIIRKRGPTPPKVRES